MAEGYNSSTQATGNIRASAILTGSYVAGTIIDTEGATQLILDVAFTKGSLTTAEIKVEFSPDGTTYYQESSSSVASGVDTVSLAYHQLSATGNYRIAIPVMDKKVKVSVKGTGTATSSLMAVDYIIGTN